MNKPLMIPALMGLCVATLALPALTREARAESKQEHSRERRGAQGSLGARGNGDLDKLYALGREAREDLRDLQQFHSSARKVGAKGAVRAGAKGAANMVKAAARGGVNTAKASVKSGANAVRAAAKDGANTARVVVSLKAGRKGASVSASTRPGTRSAMAPI